MRKINHWFVLLLAAGFLVAALLFGFFGLGSVKGAFTVAATCLLAAVALFAVWRRHLYPADV
ncbi:MAG: hypothetical protein UX89_C0021G0013 [Parcubacteria group bacterium GW2011_GWA2_47_16]|nr:MAG: hypothetical protein UX89_C0021G0013 [Parcubacteria group bacterium GW2011_GWA2_47_16]